VDQHRLAHRRPAPVSALEPVFRRKWLYCGLCYHYAGQGGSYCNDERADAYWPFGDKYEENTIVQNLNQNFTRYIEPAAFISLVFFIGFMPFFSPIPIATDVQPFFFVMAAIALAARNDMRYLYKVEVVLILFAILSLLYPYDASNMVFMPSIRFIFSAISYGFFRRFIPRLTQKTIFYISVANLLLLLFHFVSPSTFIALFSHFVRVIKIDVIGVRGASGLAPEPGFAGAITVCILAASFLLKDFRNDERYIKYIFVISFLSVALTRSGTGTLLLGVFIMLRYGRFNYKSLVLLGAALTVGIFVINNFDIGRGGSSIILLIKNPQLALLQDGSMGARVLNFAIGVRSAIETPLGYGTGSYNQVAPQISQRLGLSDLFLGNIGTLSTFATYSVELGISFWFLTAFLFLKSFRNLGKQALPYTFLSLYFLTTTFSLAFPPTWFFIAATHTNWKRGSRKTMDID